MPRILFTLATLLALPALAQTPQTAPTPAPVPAQPRPPVYQRDYAGPQVHIPGLFISPIANAPFSATVHIVSHEKLPDGSEHIVTTLNHVARTSSGMIYNERRLLVPAGFRGEPRLLSSHIYNPTNRLDITLDPFTHLAREIYMTHPPALTPGPIAVSSSPTPGLTETDLGAQTMSGEELHGLRRTRTIAAEHSATGKPVLITDDYWYSPTLSIYLTVSHNDPRTGEQLVAVTDITRGEPDGTRFRVPDDYKIVDETPLPPPKQK